LFINASQAEAVLAERRPDDAAAQWAVSQGFAIVLDGRGVPLAVASPDLMRRFEKTPRADTGAGVTLIRSTP
jgi:hypothetical protein